eukprot:scpid81128/ scgid5986/ 
MPISGSCCCSCFTEVLVGSTMDAQEEPYPNSSGYVSDASTNWSSQTSPAEGLEVDSGERVLDLEKSITMLLTAGDVDAARSLFQFASFAKEAEHQGRISTQKEPAEQPPALHGHQSLQAEHRAQARQRDATRDATPAELALRAELDAMRAERDALRVQCDAARVESEAMRAQRDALWAKFHVGKQNQSGIVEFAARSLLPPKSVGRPQGSSIAEALYEKASLRGTVGEEARYSLIIGPPPPSLPNPKANVSSLTLCMAHSDGDGHWVILETGTCSLSHVVLVCFVEHKAVTTELLSGSDMAESFRFCSNLKCYLVMLSCRLQFRLTTSCVPPLID